jgi:hypothetical protein
LKIRGLMRVVRIFAGTMVNKAEWLKYWILKHRNGAKSAFLPIKGQTLRMIPK